jgi:acetyl esterase/lipase
MGARTIDPKDLVAPELGPALEIVLQLFPQNPGAMTQESIDAMRARGAAMAKPLLDAPRVEERLIPGRAGAPDVKVHVINANPAVVRPAILHMHGGGFVAGSARGSIPDLQVAAEALDCVVVTVEYRLAPETRFPGALEDNYAALAWLYANAAELGVDCARIAVQGESAGAGHAAMLAIAARDRSEYPVCFQALLQPMLDDRTSSVRHPPAHIGAFLWRPELNVGGWTALLGSAPGGAAPNGAVPAREDDLSGLPPAFIGVGSIDLFVEESIEYARRLCEAGVPTELLVVSGAFHGFDFAAPAAGITRRYRLAYFNALARAFGRAELAAAPDPAPIAIVIAAAAS